MAKLEPRLEDLHETSILGRAERRKRRRPPDHVQESQVVDGSDEERFLGLFGKLLDARRERALDMRWDRNQAVHLARLRRDQLENRERIPATHLRDPLRLLPRHRSSRARQRDRVGRAQPGELEHREPGHVESVGLARPEADEDGDIVRIEPPQGERERCRRRTIQPLRVIDHHQQRGLAIPREEAQRCRADREPVTVTGGAHRQRSLECAPLTVGKVADRAEKRSADVEQGAERHGRLRFDAHRANHPHPGRALDRVIQQGRLPDSRLAAHDQHPAPAFPGIREQLTQLRALDIPTQQHSTQSMTRTSGMPSLGGRTPVRNAAIPSDGRGGTPTRAGASFSDPEPSSDRRRQEMTSRITKITTCVAALAVTAGIGAPAGFAAPTGHAVPSLPDGPTRTAPPDSTSSAVRLVAVTPDEAGFDWTAAAIGGLATAGAGLVAVGIGRDVRRRHEPRAV